MSRLYPDSISAVAFVVVIVLGLAAYCRLVWVERDRDHTAGPMHPASRAVARQCEVTYCRTRAVAVVHSRRGTLRVCRDCSEFLCSDAGGYEEVTSWT